MVFSPYPWDSDDDKSYGDNTYGKCSVTLLAMVSKIESLRTVLNAFANRHINLTHVN